MTALALSGMVGDPIREGFELDAASSIFLTVRPVARSRYQRDRNFCEILQKRCLFLQKAI
jgi:hypothetical protein